MLTPTPSESCQSTTSTTSRVPKARTSARKRKSIHLSTPASTQSHNVKRIKTETSLAGEPQDSKPASTIADSIYDAIVSIEVGEMPKVFGIHRGLLRRASKFFRIELAPSKTTESGVVAQVIVIKDENPEVFRRFKDWLYSGKVISGSETYRALAWSELIALYTFGDRKGISQLQNSCVDAIIRKRKEGGLFPGQADINTLWRASGQLSRLRRLLLDMFTAECNLRNALATNRVYHPGFLQGLVQTLYDSKEKRTIYDEVDFWKRRRIYYVDDDENPIVVD